MYQIIAVGATGYTGRFVAKHLSEKQDSEQFSWAIAGRNTEKLQKLKCDLSLSDDVGIITSDIMKPEDADSLAKQAEIIITTVGPYSLYSEQLVRACAESGTHLIDITGEVLWVKDMIERYESTAKKSGAIIVNCSGGIDAISADVGTYMAWNYLKEKYGAETKFTDYRSVYVPSGGFLPSGGTIASALNMGRLLWEGGKEAIDRANNKYLLVSSDMDAKTYGSTHPAQHNVSPFEDVMLSFCVCSWDFQVLKLSKVVYRTGSLLKEDDGKDPYNDLHFSEVVGAQHGGVHGAIEAFLCALSYHVTVATGRTAEGKVVKVLLGRLRKQGLTLRMADEKVEWSKKTVAAGDKQD